jgi:hypothetical protein
MNVCCHRLFLGILTVFVFAGCANIELTPQGEKVRLLSLQEVGKCRYIGKVSSSVTDRVGIITRDPEVVREEIAANARNSAGAMDGDTIVSVSPLTDGKQTFDVYRCINP